MNDSLAARIAALNAAVAHHAAPSRRVAIKARDILDTAQLFEQYLFGFPAPNPHPLVLDEASRRLAAAEQIAKQADEQRSQQAHVLATQEWTAAQLLLGSVPLDVPGRAGLQAFADKVRGLLMQAPR